MTFGIEANDNINVSKFDQESDIILRPSVQAQVGYSFARDNRLTLNLNVGYAKFIAYPKNDTAFINTEGITGLNLQLHISRTLVNLHSRFSLEQDPVNEGEVSGRADYRRFINISGFSIEPESDHFPIVFGYDHITELYDAAYADQDRSIESVYGQFGLRAGESALYSLVLGCAYVGATPGANNVGFTYSISLRASSQLSEYLRFQAEAGLGSAQFAGSLVPSDSDQVEAFFGHLAVQNRLNRWISQTLRVGTDLQPSLLSNYRNEIYVTHSVAWTVIHNVSLSSQLSFVNSVSSLSVQGGRFNQYIAGLNLSVQLAPKLEGRLNYRFTFEDATFARASYSQNQLILALTRRF